MDAHRAALRRNPQRHVLEVGLVGRGAAAQEALGIVAGRFAVAGIVVDDLVVVPGQDPRMRGVGGLQIGVALVQRVAVAVGVQRVRRACAVLAHFVGGAAPFIDVVADEEHEVHLAAGDLAMRSEVALLVVLAGSEREAQAPYIRIGRRRGARMADRADGIATPEAIPVVALRLQALRVDVHAQGSGSIGHHLAAGDGSAQGSVRMDLVLHRARVLRKSVRIPMPATARPGSILCG